jgi:hypothetical protein
VTAEAGNRSEVVRRLAGELVGRRAAGPLRVAVDGRSAARKTTLLNILEQHLSSTQRIAKLHLGAFNRQAAAGQRRDCRG